ncbi:MAG TPA: VTT domain-containing protein [Bryobacteraceae bacterium]|nr:VTT domain-containing protein [Bryobacteraceae bacterium]
MLATITEFLVALGPWGILLVSFIDSAGIPLTVGLDFLVILLSANQPRLAPVWAALAVLGSSAGNMVLYHAARKGGERLLKPEIPGTRRWRFRQWFQRYGLVTVFIPALIPIPMPMKFFVVCSGALCTRPLYFLLTVLLARILRYGVEAYLGVQLGEHSMQYIRDHPTELALFAVLLFAALYLLIRVSGRRQNPDAESV